MTQHWVIAPYSAEKPAHFEKVWKYCLDNKLIGIGWRRPGNISGLDKPTLLRCIEEKYPEKPKQTQSLFCNMLFSFYNEIKKGDKIVARRGRKILLAIGTVTKTAYYSEETGKESVGGDIDYYMSNFIGVDWQGSPRDLKFDRDVPFQTIRKIMENEYKSLVERGGTK